MREYININFKSLLRFCSTFSKNGIKDHILSGLLNKMNNPYYLNL